MNCRLGLLRSLGYLHAVTPGTGIHGMSFDTMPEPHSSEPEFVMSVNEGLFELDPTETRVGVDL